MINSHNQEMMNLINQILEQQKEIVKRLNSLQDAISQQQREIDKLKAKA